MRALLFFSKSASPKKPKMNRRNVLVFPAGTEIGLEIYQALKYCKEVKLYGAGENISNHAKFTYPEYHTVPSVHEKNWLEPLVDVCHRLSIDYIMPAHDDALVALSDNRSQLTARLIAPSQETCTITRSKLQTYRRLRDRLRVPFVYDTDNCSQYYPLIVKPDCGQGSFGVSRVHNHRELLAAMSQVTDPIICEYLPGDEYTIDCFSDRDLGLLFSGARCRRRTRNGIALNTNTVALAEAADLAAIIHQELELYGAWFFQLKRAASGELALLEVAPRVAGSMSTHRMMGVNFPLLSIFEMERLPLSILVNAGDIEVDRALGNRYRHTLRYGTLYVDLDDTLLIDGAINTHLIKLIYASVNLNKTVKLITRHREDLTNTLAKYRLSNLFDEVIHLRKGEPKSSRIIESDAILIDDSFSERSEVAKSCGIHTFDCSMIELLSEQAEFLNGAQTQ
jgi:carbamoyl-phosphate synthase large subunit